MNINILLEDYPDVLKLVGYDDCIVGIVTSCHNNPVLCYSQRKILKKLQQDGMSEIEAIEYYEFNILGSYMGEKTPCFMIT
jgi:hypothetical protein